MNDKTNEILIESKNLTALGVVVLILGMLAMMAPGFTGISIAMLLGILVLIAGVVRIVWAFHAGNLGRGILMFLWGGLTLACGIGLLANPIFAAGVLTMILVVYFLADGVVELIAGSQRWGAGGGWLVLGGAISLMLGVMIWRQFPLSGPYAMGILLGIKLFFVGLVMITGSSALRAAAKV